MADGGPPFPSLPACRPVTTVLLTTAALLVGCALVGGGVLALAGLGGPRGSAPAVGLAALMTVAVPPARLDATAAAVALVALPLVALAVPAARRIALGSL